MLGQPQQFGQAPDQEHGGVQSAKRRQRVYQLWQGNERFFCWGYLVAGPNWKASIGTAMLILAPAGIFLAFVAPYMGAHVHVIILVISCILPVLSVLYLMMTACRDPGIITRQEPDQEYLGGQKPRTKEVYVNNQRVVIRYNDTCHFYQPPRAHHCSVNDNCIERFDHHCPWVGTTIGLRNYRTFLLFVYSSTVLCLYVFGVCVAMLFVKHSQLADEAREAGRSTDGLWGKAIGKCIAALALMGYTFLFFWFVGGLSVFHAYLVGTNQTTYENFRYNHDNRPNPYSRGVLRNCAEVWCSRVPASKVKFRSYVDEFHPPTGQPSSPYLNGAGAQGPDGGNGTPAQGDAAAGGGYGGGGGPAPPGPIEMTPPSPYGAMPAGPMAAAASPEQQHHHQAVGALGGGGGGAYGYTGGGGASYDPAALPAGNHGPYNAGPYNHHGHAAQQQHHQAQHSGGGADASANHTPYGTPPYGGAPHTNTSSQRQLHAGTEHSTGYSDAGAGWGAGGEPPARVHGHHTFTHQSLTHQGAAGGGAPLGGPYGGHDHAGADSPRGGDGGGYSASPGPAAAHHPHPGQHGGYGSHALALEQGAGHQGYEEQYGREQYDGEQYDPPDDLEGYDEAEEEEQPAEAVARPAHVRPSVPP